LVKRHRRLRRLTPDAELFRRRAAGETVRELAPDYGVSHTTLSRFFARPEARKELKRAEQLHRAEQRAADVRFRAEQHAAEARLRAEQQAEREARRRPEQQNASLSESIRRDDASASTASPYFPPLELKPFSEEWLAWYAARRLRSRNDLLNHNDARRGIMPPFERRARERGGTVG
jgi:hypothetical protein